MSNKKWSDSSTFAFIAVLFVCLVYFIGYFSLLPWVQPCDSPLGIYDPARYLSCKSVNELGA
ncbi:hypothetical protein C8J31_11492 [Rhizobium sp. PP-CC-2G-626]|nr:hypothetical protein C8J31_11492 [Rhizobium sp. PP-CC-2G-626]